MLCQNCGKQQQEAALFCKDCGERLVATDQGSPDDLPTATAVAEQTMQKRSLTMPIIVGLAAVIVIVIALFTFGPFSAGNNKATTPRNINEVDAASVQIGDVLLINTFTGRPYQLDVLDVSDGKVLVIFKDSFIPRNHEFYNSGAINKDVTWETCALRSWLNSEFLYNFSDEDKRKLVKTTLANPANPEYGTPGGNPTEDYLFLLSIDEASHYYANDSDRTDRVDGGSFNWWLRSPGVDSHSAAVVDCNGKIDLEGFAVNGEYTATRPAFWLDLAS